MTETKNIAVLFDFDGVVVDTETQYSIFWHKMGVDYLGMEDLESRVKGQTLVYIYNTFFPGMIKEQEEITAGLDRFEQEGFNAPRALPAYAAAAASREI